MSSHLRLTLSISLQERTSSVNTEYLLALNAPSSLVGRLEHMETRMNTLLDIYPTVSFFLSSSSFSFILLLTILGSGGERRPRPGAEVEFSRSRAWF